MPLNLDPRKILSHPVIYTSYQKIVGGYRARKLFVENNVNIQSGQKILDIGCGPGDILPYGTGFGPFAGDVHRVIAALDHIFPAASVHKP